MSSDGEVMLEPQCGNGTVPRPSQRPEFLAATSFFFYFSFVVMAVCLIPWVLLKNRFERTQFRSTTLVLMPALALLDDMMFFHLAPLMGTWLPCVPIAFLSAVVVPLVFGPIITRLLILLVLTRFSEDAADSKRPRLDTIEDSLELDQGKVSFRTIIPALQVAFGALKRTNDGVTGAASNHVQRLSALRIWSSGYGLVTIMALLLLPFLLLAVVVIASQRNLLACYRCDRVIMAASFGILVLGLLLVMFGAYVYSLVRHFHDAWGLRRECLWSLIVAALAILFFFLGIFVRSISNRVLEEGLFRFSYLITLSLWAALIINTLAQLYLARRSHLKHAQPLRTFSRPGIDLDGVLNNKDLCNEFEQHLVQEFGIESLLFLKDVEAWKRAYFDIAPNARKVRAQKIHATYIALDGLLTVNVPWHMANEIKRAVQASSDVQSTLFDAAEAEIRGLLSIGALSRFLASRSSSLSVGSLGNAQASKPQASATVANISI